MVLNNEGALIVRLTGRIGLTIACSVWQSFSLEIVDAARLQDRDHTSWVL